MFNRSFFKVVNEPKNTNLLSNYFDEEFDFSEEEQEPSIKRQPSFECVFEPIYRREPNQFVPAGHKAVAKPVRLSGENERIVLNENTTSLFQTLQHGTDQLVVLETQIDNFLELRTAQSQQKLVVEVDIYDLNTNLANLDRLSDLIDRSALKGLKTTDIVVELSSCTGLDQGIVFTIAQRLREIGVMVALTNIDADSFSFKRIFQIRPDIVKFNRSWCDLPLDDPQYISMVRTLVENIHQKGIHTALTGVRNRHELKFAAACEFIRCQGIYFGTAMPQMDTGPIFFQSNSFCCRTRPKRV